MYYELIYQLDAIEYLFVYFQLDKFRAYTPIFRSNRCYNFLHQVGKLIHNSNQNARYNYPKKYNM